MPVIWSRTAALALCIAATFGVTAGWWDQGHMVVSQIAHDSLSAGARTEFELLLTSLAEFYPQASTTLLVGAWMDDIKKDSKFKSMHAWHYKDIPIFADSYNGTRDIPEDHENLLWAIAQSVATIRNQTKPTIEKAFALRVLIHLVGDLHQPLHTVSRYSAEHPRGDQGGNYPRYIAFGKTAKLHQVWDNASGYFEVTLIYL
jgi:hypothetical protein